MSRPPPARGASSGSPTGPSIRVGVVGLGYVGLPLAVEFGHAFETVGYDVSEGLLESIRRGVDPNGQVPTSRIRGAVLLQTTADASALAKADVIAVTVPTPVDIERRPDLSALLAASRAVGRCMRWGTTVVYESTVYPGATEEVCVPALEAASGMRWKRDFFVGYSPERVNPGDPEHRLAQVTKVVAGDTDATAALLERLYGAIVPAGVHRASSIRVAEAAKVIENTQRDLNIALVNELAMLCDRIGLDTAEVLAVAETKWNFASYRPGLVGGHCIGVDPYYLAHKARQVGLAPRMILAGREVNDGMAAFVAERVAARLGALGRPVEGAAAIVLGLAFKENVTDLRNSRVPDLVRALETKGMRVEVHDPVADAGRAWIEHGIELRCWEALPVADAVILAVPHRELVEAGLDRLLSRLADGGLFADLKGAFEPAEIERRRVASWRL